MTRLALVGQGDRGTVPLSALQASLLAHRRHQAMSAFLPLSDGKRTSRIYEDAAELPRCIYPLFKICRTRACLH
jgi:hypothetical protein